MNTRKRSHCSTATGCCRWVVSKAAARWFTVTRCVHAAKPIPGAFLSRMKVTSRVRHKSPLMESAARRATIVKFVLSMPRKAPPRQGRLQAPYRQPLHREATPGGSKGFDPRQRDWAHRTGKDAGALGSHPSGLAGPGPISEAHLRIPGGVMARHRLSWTIGGSLNVRFSKDGVSAT